MKALFLIVEYNPFHNGHSHHITESKKITACDHVIVIMSGNYVQRGEPAILDKWARAEAALQNGADLVIELPVYYATASAALFAEGAVRIANSTGLPGALCFGSESGELSLLQSAAQTLMRESGPYKAVLKEQLAAGRSFPAARSAAFLAAGGKENETALLTEPNNILAIEYCMALEKINAGITPFTIKRVSAHYHDTQIQGISSAGAIRNALRGQGSSAAFQAMPQSAYEILCNEIERGTAPADMDALIAVYHYLLKTRTPHALQEILDINEGLENRMLTTAEHHSSFQGIIKALKTKRYTHTMLQRAVLHLLLGITKKDFAYFQEAGGPQYIRVLGFKKEKTHLLQSIDAHASLPLLMNIKNASRSLSAPGMKMLAKEIETSDIYTLCMPSKKNTPEKNQEYKRPIVIYSEGREPQACPFS